MIAVHNLVKRFKLYSRPSDRLREALTRSPRHREFHALKDLSFQVEAGETLGIIGVNGSGKSTLLKILTGVILPDAGSILVEGRITGLLELGTGFNPDFSGYDNIFMNATYLGMSHAEVQERLDRIISFSELEDFIHEPLKTYSSGMTMRLAFSIAIHAQPRCFVVDEALSVGDAHFQQKCMNRIREFKAGGGTILFVSHDLATIKMLSDRVMLLDKGDLVEIGDPDMVVNRYNYLLACYGEDGKRLTAAPEGAYGTFDARISKVTIQGCDSGADLISSGEECRIDVDLTAKISLKELTVGIMIRDRFGQDIYGINTHYLNIPVSIGANETRRVSFSFPVLLQQGKYTLTVALHVGSNHQDACYHWLDNAASFQIAGLKGVPFAGVTDLRARCQVQEKNV
jgi:lipopolysaccharide transport system ATP-binding protein